MQSKFVFGSRCAALLAVLTAIPAYAETWNYGTQLGLSSDWNDNPALVDDDLDPEGTFRFLAIYEGEFERREYDTSLKFRPRVTTDYYPDSKFSKLQTTDYFLPGNFSYRRPASVWTLGFNASQQSVLSSEASTSQGVTVGLLESDDTLTQLSLAPSLTWQLSERDELIFGLSYGLSNYDVEFTNRTDSNTVGGNISYRRSLDERNTVGITAFISSSDADRKVLIPIPVDPPTDPPTIDRIEEGKVDINSDSNFITADYSYAFSESSTLSMSYGLQDATTESITSLNSTGASNSTGSLSFNSTTYNIRYLSEGPRSKYTVEAIRSVTLDITSGQPQDRYEINFDGEYKITERLQSGWEISAWQQEAIALQALDENNLPIDLRSKPRYTNAAARLSWNITRKWYLTGRYEYRWRSNDQTFGTREFNQKAVSNNISIGITYLWKEIPR